MCCTTKSILIIILILVVLYLVFQSKTETFVPVNINSAETINEYTQKELKEFDTTISNTHQYNYNPIPLQCPETSNEVVSWDINTKVCVENNNLVSRTCPKDMIREGDYCYLPCENGYNRKNGICWKQ